MDWEITIKKADNGFVLSYPVELREDSQQSVTRHIAIEDPEDGDETITTQKLLWEIMEYFGRYGSKHDAVRVRVIRQNQDGKEIQD